MANVANGLAYSAKNSQMAIGDEFVELVINQLPHEVFVFFEAFRCQQLAQQRPRARVRAADP